MRSRLAEIPGLWPIHVALLVSQAKAQGADNPPGWIIRHIDESRLPGLIEPKTVCSLINNGRIARIAEIEIAGLNGDRARWNDHELYLPGGKSIPASELRASAIKMAGMGDE